MSVHAYRQWQFVFSANTNRCTTVGLEVPEHQCEVHIQLKKALGGGAKADAMPDKSVFVYLEASVHVRQSNNIT